MNEIKELVAFMRSGNRKEILLEEYLSLRRKKKGWNKKRESQLLTQLEMSFVVSIDYKQKNKQLKRNLKLIQE